MNSQCLLWVLHSVSTKGVVVFLSHARLRRRSKPTTPCRRDTASSTSDWQPRRHWNGERCLPFASFVRLMGIGDSVRIVVPNQVVRLEEMRATIQDWDLSYRSLGRRLPEAMTSSSASVETSGFIWVLTQGAQRACSFSFDSALW